MEANCDLCKRTCSEMMGWEGHSSGVNSRERRRKKAETVSIGNTFEEF